jgi:hypothetical protein
MVSIAFSVVCTTAATVDVATGSAVDDDDDDAVSTVFPLSLTRDEAR